MKALCWYGQNDVRVETVPDPQLLNPRDAIIKITSTAICGSDLHLLDGFIPMMKAGDILGHEFMGEVVELGSDVTNLKKGDRVVVPFTIACGRCYFCERQMWSLCDNSNPQAAIAEKVYGASGSALFGYSHIYGGFAGGQAEYVRVPFADVGPYKVPDEINDEHALFLSDILPTGYQAAENGKIEGGDVVAVWGCGPVGQFCIQSAWLLGAERVIAIDQVPERLEMAAKHGRAETIDFSKASVLESLQQMTGGRGPDVCIDAVGMEAHGLTADAIMDKALQLARMESDRPHVLREMIMACRKGGHLSIPGVYGGIIDKFNFGAAFAKGLTFKMGQTHVHRYMPTLMEHIQQKKLDPTFIITHRLPLSDAPKGYHMFKEKADGCVKVVLTP
jgi:threonine dehydrogenase-like Zn-dependent dehydrogenase